MTPITGDALLGAGTSIFGAGLGLLSNWENNRLAKERETFARQENYTYGEMAADAADARTRGLYYDLYSPKAQLQQLKDAGLSPSLMYGDGGGISGQSGAMGSGASGISPNVFGWNPIQDAQLGLIAAQTAKTTAEADNVKGIANATVSSLLAEAGYKEASAAAAKAQTASIELDNYVKEKSKDANVSMILAKAEESAAEAAKAWAEAKKADLAIQFDTETFNTRKQIVQEQMKQIVQSIAESKSQQHLNEQQRQYFRDLVLKNISDTMLNWSEYSLSTEKFDTFINKQIPLMEKELDVEIGKLELKKKELIKDAIVESFKGLCIGAATASTIGRGGNLTPTQPTTKTMPKSGGNAVNNTVWDY